MLVFCSPHNPGGRVWTQSELEQVAAFAKRHDLVLVSDEIHHDLVMPGNVHTPMALIDGVEDRLVMMTTTKTFNIAGSHSGNVIIPDPDLREKFAARMAAMGLSPNSFGLFWRQPPIPQKVPPGSMIWSPIWTVTDVSLMKQSTAFRG